MSLKHGQYAFTMKWSKMRFARPGYVSEVAKSDNINGDAPVLEVAAPHLFPPGWILLVFTAVCLALEVSKHLGVVFSYKLIGSCKCSMLMYADTGSHSPSRD